MIQDNLSTLHDECITIRAVQARGIPVSTIYMGLNKLISTSFQLYEDSKACVLTREYLEAEQTELEEDFAVPVTIICLVGGLGKLVQF